MAEENENKRSFLETLGDVAARVGEGVVDGIAETRPLIGRPLQYGLSAAGFNTEGYQDRQDQRAARKEALLAKRRENEEWAANAPVRDASRDARLELLDAADLDRGVRQNADNLCRDLSRNPMFKGATYDELRDIMKSKKLGPLLQGMHYVNKVKNMAGGDKEAYGYLDRSLKRLGWGVKMPKEKGGVPMLQMGELGELPATPESMNMLIGNANKLALDEINARSRLLSANSLGNPARRAINRYTRDLMPYNGRNASDSERIVQDVFNQASDSEKTILMCRQAMDDYRDPNMPVDAKMAGLAACQPFLQSIGFTVDGYDPKNPDIDKLRFIDMRDPEHFQTMTTSQFEEFLKENDTLGMNMESRVQQIGDRYRQENKIRLANINRNQMQQAANELKTGKAGKAAKPSDKTDASTSSQTVPSETISKLAASYGDDVHTWNEDQIERLSVMDKRINQYAVQVGAIVKNDKGQYVLSQNTAAIRKIADQFDKFTLAFGIKNVSNPWKKYTDQSVAADRKSLQKSTVPAAQNNAMRIYQQNEDFFKKRLGIRGYDAAIRFAEYSEGDYGVGLGAASDPDREKKRKILSDLLKAHRNAQKMASHAR